jgi:hypothetical protein
MTKHVDFSHTPSANEIVNSNASTTGRVDAAFATLKKQNAIRLEARPNQLSMTNLARKQVASGIGNDTAWRCRGQTRRNASLQNTVRRENLHTHIRGALRAPLNPCG